MEYMITYLPDYAETQREMGYDDHDDVDSDAVLFQQGYNMRHLLVEPGDTFEIKREHRQATFQCDGNSVCLFSDHPAFDEVIDEDAIGLEPGKYKLSDDGKSIERLDFDDDDFY